MEGIDFDTHEADMAPVFNLHRGTAEVTIQTVWKGLSGSHHELLGRSTSLCDDL